MDEAIIKQWNSQVNPEDEVWFLGDFGINKKKCLDKELVSKLNGTKYIVIGNHDFFFTRSHKKGLSDETINQYLDAGWSSVHLDATIQLMDNTYVTMTHLPPSNENDNRYSQFKLSNNPDMIYLSGHLHSHYRKKRNMIDVCFDGDLKLLSEQDVIDLINNEEDFIPTRLTNKFSQEICLMLMPFEEEVKKKNIRRVVSDDKKLVLYSYTDQCTYKRAWNEITRVSRGIIFEKETGKIVALPMSKFFNVGEQPESKLENLPDEKYTITEKADGSLGIIFNYEDKWRLATRGSFTSEQAIRAQEILKQYDMSKIPKYYTLLVEIIYPENKIVVNYGDDEKLVLLTIFNRDTQEELPYHKTSMSYLMGMPEVKIYYHTIEEMIELQKTLPKDEEGFVVRFESGLRVKIKGHEYLKIHKLISQMSPLSFWESMKEGSVDVSYIEELPEEYRREADEIVEKLEQQYFTIYTEINNNFHTIIIELDIDLDEDTHEQRKKLGIYLKENKPKHASAFFSLYKNNFQAVEKYIQHMIRPTGNIWRDI